MINCNFLSIQIKINLIFAAIDRFEIEYCHINFYDKKIFYQILDI
jgi:hypothetical protein